MIKILLMEDDEEMCEELKSVLEAESYFVKISHNREEGMDFIKKSGYCIVLLDLKMPGINGRQVLKQIKNEYPLTKVIILTGSPLPKDLLQEKDPILQLADSLINKPFDPAHLITIINKLKN